MALQQPLRLALPLALALGSLPSPLAASPIFNVARLGLISSESPVAGTLDPVSSAFAGARSRAVRPRIPAAPRGTNRPGVVAAPRPRPGQAIPKPAVRVGRAEGGGARPPGGSRGQIGRALVIRGPRTSAPKAPAARPEGGTPAAAGSGSSGAATSPVPAGVEPEDQATSPTDTTRADLSGFEVSQSFRAEDGTTSDPETRAGEDTAADVRVAGQAGDAASTPTAGLGTPSPTAATSVAATPDRGHPAPAVGATPPPAAGVADGATSSPGNPAPTAGATTAATTGESDQRPDSAAPTTPAPSTVSPSPASGAATANGIESKGQDVGTSAATTAGVARPQVASATPATTAGLGASDRDASGPATPATTQAGATPGAWPSHAGLITDGRTEDVGTPGAPGNQALATSDPGPGLGTTTLDPAATEFRPFLPDQGSPVDLVALGGTTVVAHDPGAGVTLGEALIPSLFGNEQLHALLGSGREPLGVRDLAAAPLDAELARATSINDVGQVVDEGVGLATGRPGGSHGSAPPPIVPMPPPTPAPEPATWVLFAAACLPLLRRARRAGIARGAAR